MMWMQATAGVSALALLAVRRERRAGNRRERNAFELGRDAERLLVSPARAAGD